MRACLMQHALTHPPRARCIVARHTQMVGKVADFGLSRGSTGGSGTGGVWAPEPRIQLFRIQLFRGNIFAHFK